MQIVDLLPHDGDKIEQTAALLVIGFAEMAPEDWRDMASAREEVHDSFGEERLSRVAVNDAGTVLGWIGGISQYKGNVWELHPIVVHPDYREQGIGRALVVDLEAQVRTRGGCTMFLGSDDETGMTSLTGVDLYDDLWAHVSSIRNHRRHPYEFYQKLGFTIVGVVPDANGPGRPDILMAKRVRRTG
jgi:aminoglycoside 6'-N-acetyltransferase I